MEVSKRITIDLNRPTKNTVHLVQGDNTHEINLVLLKDGVPFAPESGLTGVSKSVKYIASDGSGDENTGGVTIVSGTTNEYTVKLNHGETNVPGFTDVFVVFSKDGNILHTFPITLDVIKTDADISPTEPTYNVFLRKDAQVAKSSNMTQAVGVDESGKLWVEPGGGGGSVPVYVTVNSQGVTDVAYSDIVAYHNNGRVVILRDSLGLEYGLLTIDATHSEAVFYAVIDGTTQVIYRTVSVSGTTATSSSRNAYVVPSGGIPKTVLASDVQTSLGKADTASQPPTVVTVTEAAVVIDNPANNTLYKCTNTGITSVTISNYSYGNAFSVKFNIQPSTTPTITIDQRISQPTGFTFEDNKHYEINVDDGGYALIGGWVIVD